jgi:hypothetical protein
MIVHALDMVLDATDECSYGMIDIEIVADPSGA